MSAPLVLPLRCFTAASTKPWQCLAAAERFAFLRGISWARRLTSKGLTAGTDVCYGSDGTRVAVGSLFCIVLQATFAVAGEEASFAGFLAAVQEGLEIIGTAPGTLLGPVLGGEGAWQ